jgi:hypothetical protein
MVSVKPNASYEPVDAVVLCLDAAKEKSGSSLIIPNRHARGGIEVLHACLVQDQADREACVRHLYAAAFERNLAPAIYAERWMPVGKSTYDTILGLGEGWGWWTAEFNRAAAAHADVLPKLVVERATPDEWRDGIFGARRPRKRDPLKELAIAYVQSVLGLKVGDDVAESLCIGLFGIRERRFIDEVRKWKKRHERMLRAKETAA